MVKTLKTKMLSCMPNWKPSCFIIDDAPQELNALGKIPNLILDFYLTLCLMILS
jgi:hypothetical protein